MSLAFDKSRVVKEYKDEITNLQKSNDELAKKVGNLTIEKYNGFVAYDRGTQRGSISLSKA
jgi:hypothetical protein